MKRLAVILALAGAATAGTQAHVARPFAVGERAEYDVSYGIFHAGTGSLDLMGIDTVRGHAAYRFRLIMSAGVRHIYSLQDTMQSWLDTTHMTSLRFWQDQLDGGKPRHKRYEIFADRGVYTENGKEAPVQPNPLDEISFLYFVRTRSLDTGTFEFPNYFKPESNPVKLRILRRETIEAAGRKWKTVVVQPIIKTSTIFNEGGGAHVWMSDDSARVIVRITSHIGVADLDMRLKSYRQSTSAPTQHK